MAPPLTITSIPPEVLGDIFFGVLDGTLTIPSPNLTTLFHITQTCSSWRAIAIRHPHIWTNLSINLQNWSDSKVIDTASLCLSHSAHVPSLPLSIRIHVEQYLDYWSSRIGISSPTFLAPHAGRIRQLSIQSPILLAPLALSNIAEIEVFTPEWEGHADMHVQTILQRFGGSITRLSVGRVPHWDWHVLLERMPRLEILSTKGRIPDDVLWEIVLGKLGLELKEVKCGEESRSLDILLEILKTRTPEGKV